MVHFINSFDRINPPLERRPAPQEPAKRQNSPFHRPMFLYGFQGILGAGRSVNTYIPKESGKILLISAYNEYQKSRHDPSTNKIKHLSRLNSTTHQDLFVTRPQSFCDPSHN